MDSGGACQPAALEPWLFTRTPGPAGAKRVAREGSAPDLLSSWEVKEGRSRERRRGEGKDRKTGEETSRS